MKVSIPWPSLSGYSSCGYSLSKPRHDDGLMASPTNKKMLEELSLLPKIFESKGEALSLGIFLSASRFSSLSAR